MMTRPLSEDGEAGRAVLNVWGVFLFFYPKCDRGGKYTQTFITLLMTCCAVALVCCCAVVLLPSCAMLAKEGGYDGVEVMGSEGYLINQFLVKHTNKR